MHNIWQLDPNYVLIKFKTLENLLYKLFDYELMKKVLILWFSNKDKEFLEL